MYSNSMFIDHLLCELSCKNTHRPSYTDSEEYSLVAFMQKDKYETISQKIIKVLYNKLFSDKITDINIC